MNKTDLITAIAERTELSRSQVREAVEATFGVMAESLGAHEKVTIAGFGSFTVIQKAGRTGVNPRTKLPIEIPSRETVRFKVGNALARAIEEHNPSRNHIS